MTSWESAALRFLTGAAAADLGRELVDALFLPRRDRFGAGSGSAFSASCLARFRFESADPECL